MKKNLLSIFVVLTSLCASLFAHAQIPQGPACYLGSISAEVSGTPVDDEGNCRPTLNLYFVATVSGPEQRFLTLNIWNNASRTEVTYTAGAGAPTAADLGNVLATVVLERDGVVADWKISSVYGGNGAPVTTDGLALLAKNAPQNAGGLEDFFGKLVYFEIKGLTLDVPGACSDFSPSQLVADVWGAEDANNNVIACSSTNITLSDCTFGSLPIVNGNIGGCNTNQRTYNIAFNNSGNCRPFFIDYKVYLDNGNGVRDEADVQINLGDNDGDILWDNVAVLFPGQGVTFSSFRPILNDNGNLLFIEGTMVTLDENYNEVAIPLQSFELDNPCSLPVKFGLFTAQRNNQQVNLNWETAMEQNNKGFHVQRNTGSGWQTIAFVFSAADGGNSTQTLRYRYTDNNNFNGITQYRLLQEDFDGTAAYSEVKSVRGIAQAASVIVYPNPAVNGNVNLLFSDAGSRDVIVNDLSGRIVKTYREVAGNNLSISGLTTGFYTIKITDRKTATVTVEKVVVK